MPYVPSENNRTEEEEEEEDEEETLGRPPSMSPLSPSLEAKF
jgi:hypothetical protein